MRPLARRSGRRPDQKGIKTASNRLRCIFSIVRPTPCSSADQSTAFLRFGQQMTSALGKRHAGQRGGGRLRCAPLGAAVTAVGLGSQACGLRVGRGLWPIIGARRRIRAARRRFWVDLRALPTAVMGIKLAVQGGALVVVGESAGAPLGVGLPGSRPRRCRKFFGRTVCHVCASGCDVWQ